jgi:iron complex outermembrane receptor protein
MKMRIGPTRALIFLWCLCLAEAPGIAQNLAPDGVGASPAALKRLSLEELMNLDVTTVMRTPQPYRQIPAAIQVVTQDDIRRFGASRIPEALRLADSLEVAQVNSSGWAISARGFNSTFANKLLVLMDGRTLYTPLFSGVYWDAQDYLMEDIDRIEVISGPGGTLWGANAVNGIINILSKPARDTQGMLLSAGGGDQLQDIVGLRYGGTLATNIFYRVYARYFDRDDLMLHGGGNAGDPWRMGQTGFRLDWEAPGDNLITAQGDFYRGLENMPGGQDTSIGGGNFLTRWTRTFAEESSTSLQLYYDRTHRALNTGFREDFDTYDADFQYHLKRFERNDIVAGIGYRFTHDHLQNPTNFAFLPPDFDRNLLNGFLQDDIKILENLYLTLGSKIEHNQYTGWEWQPSARVSWTPAWTNHTIWGAISRAVRTPSRIDEQFFIPTQPPYLLAGGSNFISETVIAYELGYRVSPFARASFSFSAYYNDYSHLRSVSTNNPLVIENNVEGDTYGLEAEAKYQLFDWWRVGAGYTLIKEHLRVKAGAADFNRAHGETFDPQQQFSLRSSMDLPAHFELDARLRWVDRIDYFTSGTPAGNVSSYFELTAHIGWHPTENLELSVVGQNLLHDRHPEFGAPGPTQEQVPRGVYAKVTWRF